MKKKICYIIIFFICFLFMVPYNVEAEEYTYHLGEWTASEYVAAYEEDDTSAVDGLSQENLKLLLEDLDTYIRQEEPKWYHYFMPGEVERRENNRYYASQLKYYVNTNLIKETTPPTQNEINELLNKDVAWITDYLEKGGNTSNLDESVKNDWKNKLKEAQQNEPKNSAYYNQYLLAIDGQSLESQRDQTSTDADDDKIFGNADLTGNIINTTGTAGVQNPADDPNSWDPGDPGSSDKVKKIGNTIVGAINAVGIIVSVGALMLLGIRYMLGSAEEKASYKETMIPYIIGAVLVFSTTTIVNVIYQFATSL